MPIDNFRTATEYDAEAIAQLVNRAYRPEPDAAGWTHEAHLVSGDRINPGQVVDAISKDDSVVVLGLKNREIAACAHVEKDGGKAVSGCLRLIRCCKEPVPESKCWLMQKTMQAQISAPKNSSCLSCHQEPN